MGKPRVQEEVRQEILYEIEVSEEEEEVQELEERKKKRSTDLGLVAIGSLASVAAAAKMGILPTPHGFEYTDALITRDLGTAVLGGVLGYLYVKFCTSLAKKEIVEPRDSRKLIHTFSAPLYMIIWPLFTPGGRFFAACVPLVNAFRLYSAAMGDSRETELASAVSRSGDAKEALGGPFVYVIVMCVAISLFWRDSMVGITALSTMAAGDGMADLIGRRFGKNNKWPFEFTNKSVAGSTAFWLSASLCTALLATWLSYTGCLELPYELNVLIPKILAVAGACTMIELVPIGDDNWTVPISAAILASLFLE
jgi:dolichol kinase